jgi:hypothetical protein
VKRYLVLLASFVLFAVACGSLPNIPWPPIPTPPPTTTTLPQPSPSPCVCPLPDGGTYSCADPYCRCGAGACPVPTPSPTATPTPQPTATPTPVPTPSPCIPTGTGSTLQKVCVAVDGAITPFDRTKCWTAKDWLDFMMRDRWDDACACIKPGSAQFTPGDPKEDGDASGTHPGFWLNHDPSGRLVGVVHKKTATNANGVLVVDYPRVEERNVPGPVATPCPSPSPSASPTPGPGTPTVSQMGGSFLTARDCGKKCIDQGYLGYVVNVTSTPLCLNGSPGCSCDPARNRCEFPKELQDPRGSTVYLSLPGKFSHDLADERSDNPYNHQHKPKANETGVTEFLHCVYHAPWTDGRCTPKCMDIQKSGPREVPCK